MKKLILTLICLKFLFFANYQAFAATTNYRFTGQEIDNEVNLYNYKARNYSPSTGKFIQQDPVLKDSSLDSFFLNNASQEELNEFLSDPQRLNVYSYTRNNPVRYTDPTGEFWWHGFYDFEGYSGAYGQGLKFLEVYGGRNRAINAINRNSIIISEVSQRYEISEDLIKAIIYEETSHLELTESMREQMFIDSELSGNTIGLGQIDYQWGYYTKEELLNEANNIDAIGQHLSYEKSRLENQGIEASDELLASRYHHTKADQISDYGKRVSNYIRNKSFEGNSFDRFINMTPSNSILGKFK